MRCSSRSTTWLGRLLAAALAGLLAPPAAVAADRQEDGSRESAVRHAVVQAVKGRMGQDADVRIEQLEFKTTPPPEGAELWASPEPGARLGRRTRFALQWLAAPGTRRMPVAGGHVTATVFVAVEHLRAARAVERGETCAEADLTTVRGDVGAVRLQRLPGLDEVRGARAVRPIGPDEVVTRTLVQLRLAVQSGDVVAVRASVEGVSVQAQAVAQQSGSEGEIIRVVNRESRRPLKARVVGPGKVEVVQ